MSFIIDIRETMGKKIKILKWDDAYSVGNIRIDHQHKYFLNLIEHLNNSIDLNSSQEFIQNQLNEILLYTRFHFCSEENIMMQHNYIDYDLHKKLHDDILREITDKITHFVIKKADFVEVIQYMYDWFVTHTITEDIKFHQSIRNKS